MKYSILLVSVFFLSCSEPPKKEINKPNIVLIFTDDLGYGDIGCFGAADIRTPNIDGIAEAGIKFTDFYSASSVCSPSRAGLMTGRMPQRMGINGVFFPESFTGLPVEEETMADMLKGQGYSTGLVGKWHLGHHEKYLPLQRGFDYYFGMPYSNDMASAVYMRGNEVVQYNVDQSILTRTYTEEAVQFIEHNKDHPFFLYLAHNMPHVPIYASEEFKGKSARGLYGDVIEEIDWSVGLVIEKLRSTGVLENTIVVFSSDNGPWTVMEDHGGSAGVLREGKQFTFDGGMRVPTVAMWPGTIAPGTVESNLATQMDWFPTFTEASGGQPDATKIYDGKNLMKVLTQTGKRDGDTFLFFDGAELQGYRKGDWKLKLPFKGTAGSAWRQGVPAHDTLLVNIRENPEENINLKDTNREVLNSMLADMYDEYNALGELPESLVLRTPGDASHIQYLRNKKR